MKHIGAYEAKTHLPKLLDRVSRGERITITKHGTPVARLVPVAPERGRDPCQVVAELRRFRAGRKLRPGTIEKMKQEGRR